MLQLVGYRTCCFLLPKRLTPEHGMQHTGWPRRAKLARPHNGGAAHFSFAFRMSKSEVAWRSGLDAGLGSSGEAAA